MNEKLPTDRGREREAWRSALSSPQDIWIYTGGRPHVSRRAVSRRLHTGATTWKYPGNIGENR